MLVDLLLGAASDGLGSVAGSGALLLARELRHRVGGTEMEPSLRLGGVEDALKQHIARSILSADLSPAESRGLDAFVRSGECALLVRYLATAALARQHSDIRSVIRPKCDALLSLCPYTRDLETDRLSTPLLQALERALDARVEQLSRLAPGLLKELRHIAVRESRVLMGSSYAGDDSEIWELRSYDPTKLVGQTAKYCQTIVDRNATLNVPSLHEERRVPFDDVFVAPHANAPILDSVDVSVGETVLSAALTRSSRVVVLGQPGGGKSTLLRAALRSLAQAYSKDVRGVVPIHIELAAYWKYRANDPGRNILAFAQRMLKANFADVPVDAVKYLLATGKAVMLLDGLDEVLSVADRSVVRDEIEAISARYRSCAFVISSRAADYSETPLNPALFHKLLVQPFDEHQIKDFATRFFSASPSVEAGKGKLLALEFMHHTTHTGTLRSNPLTLGLLCLLYDTGRSIPSNRAELYRQCAEMLFSRWDSRRGFAVPVENSDTAEGAVTEIAAAIFKSSSDLIGEEWLRKSLSAFFMAERNGNRTAANRFAEEVISLWRGRRWLLVDAGIQDGERAFRFSHRTLLEYFAAQDLVYKSSSAGDLWPQLEKLVSERAGIVYCQLSVELFSKKSAGAGDQLIVAILKSLEGRVLRGRWNTAAFLAEVLPAMRCRAKSREEAVRKILTTLLEHVPMNDTEPRFDDGEWGVFELSDEEEREAAGDLTYRQTTLPLETLLQGSQTDFDVSSKEIERFLVHLAQNAPTAVQRGRAAKMAFEMQVLPHMREWVRLDPDRYTPYADWALGIELQLHKGLGLESLRGLDFWLDVYLCRSGLISAVSFVEQRGSLSLLYGGWGLSAKGYPLTGTPLHAVLRRGLESLKDDDREDPGLELESLRQAMLNLFDESAETYGPASERFERSPQGLQRKLFRRDISVLSAEAMQAFVLACLALVKLGDSSYLSAMDAQGCDPSFKDVRAIIGMRGLASSEFADENEDNVDAQGYTKDARGRSWRAADEALARAFASPALESIAYDVAYGSDPTR